MSYWEALPKSEVRSLNRTSSWTPKNGRPSPPGGFRKPVATLRPSKKSVFVQNAPQGEESQAFACWVSGFIDVVHFVWMLVAATYSLHNIVRRFFGKPWNPHTVVCSLADVNVLCQHRIEWRNLVSIRNLPHYEVCISLETCFALFNLPKKTKTK